MKRLKKLMAILMAFVLCITSGGLYVDSYASDTSVSEEVSTVDGAYISYEMANTKQGDAEGIIKFHFEDLAQDSVSSIKYYWVDENGDKLENYYHITEFSDSYKAGTSSTNIVANAANGFSLYSGSVIPYGAQGIKAEVMFTESDGSKKTVDITTCQYKTTVDGVSAIDSTLPQYKKSVEDFTVTTDETYQMFYISDFHNYYGWNGEEGDTYDTVAYEYINANGTKGSPQGKALYGIKKIIEEAGNNDKTLGIITAGDIVDGVSGGTGGKNATAEMYETVLATYYQAGLLGKYLSIFPNGNHDLIKAYATADGNTDQYIGFIQKAHETNIALDANEILPTVSGLTKPTDYYYDFYIGGDHYIVLSSPYESGAYGETQLAWFEEKIEKDNTEGTRTFIISHEPMTGTGIYAASEYMTDGPSLKALIENNSANHETVWFSGHTHVFYQDNIQNVAIENHEKVSYVGLPSILDTGLKAKGFYESQGMQVKIYDDKIAMIGRVLYDGSTYRTDIMPSAMYVIDYAEEDSAVPMVSIDETAAVENVLKIGSSVTASISTNDATAYQWYVGGTAIEGATDAIYTITEDTQAGRLSVAVTTANGTYFNVTKSIVVGSIIYITSSDELQHIGKTTAMPLDGHYVLERDIDLRGINWTPIGYYNGASAFNAVTSEVFTGTFDGNGHTISNITCLVDGGKYQYAGFFGALYGATVKNVRFEKCSFEAYGNGNGANAGVVTGATKSTTTPAPYSTTISNVMVENCTVAATIKNTGNVALAGGLVGYSESGVTITDCFVNANIVGNLSAGETDFSDRIGVGGLVGGAYDAKMSATNCVITGTLTSEYYGTQCENPDTTKERKNSVLGFNSRGASDSKYDEANKASVKNCYYSSAMSVNSTNPRGKDATAKTPEELGYLTAIDLSLNTELWYKDEDSVKLKISPNYSSAVIKIYSANELSQIGTDGYPLDGSYKLMRDIDMSTFDTDDNEENGNWTPIGYYSGSNAPQSSVNPFTGTFDGNGHMISNVTCTISGGTYVTVGLFGTLKDATVKNVHFANCSFSAVGKGSGAFAGVVAGTTVSSTSSNSKLVEYDTIILNVLVDSCSTYSSITTPTNLAGSGGMVGYSQSGVRINNCMVNINASAKLDTTSAIESQQIGVGGLVGISYAGKVWAVNCIVSGSLNANNCGEGVTATPAYLRYNSILGVNSRSVGNTTYDNTGVAKATNCYYDSSMNVNSNNPRGLDGTALTTVDFGIRSIETLGLDSEYWIHTGYRPVLAISGEEEWNGIPDVNEDGVVDICDLVRNKVFEEDNTIDNVLYRATNLAEDTTEDAIVVDGNDIARMREYLLGNVDVYLNANNAEHFKILGNTIVRENDLYMDHSYTGFCFNAYVEGDINLDLDYKSDNSVYAKLAVIIDGDVENRNEIEVTESGTYTIASVKAGYHTFEVVKATQRISNILYPKKLSFKGTLQEAPKEKELKIAFIGDSITATGGILGEKPDDNRVSEDIIEGYAYKTAVHLNADLAIRARSGIKTAGAVQQLLPANVDDNYDVVVIGLGTNDNTESGRNTEEQLTEDIKTMLNEARTKYPSAKIVWIYGMMIAVDNEIIKAAVNDFNKTDGNVYYFDEFTTNQDGGGNHPDVEAHTVAAEVLATYINSLLEAGVANE